MRLSVGFGTAVYAVALGVPQPDVRPDCSALSHRADRAGRPLVAGRIERRIGPAFVQARHGDDVIRDARVGELGWDRRPTQPPEVVSGRDFTGPSTRGAPVSLEPQRRRYAVCLGERSAP